MIRHIVSIPIIAFLACTACGADWRQFRGPGGQGITDGERLYVFFGKSGVYCFDLDGNQIWHAAVGKGIDHWGSGTSPILHKNLLIINASVEAGTLIAFDKVTGKEAWRGPKIRNSW